MGSNSKMELFEEIKCLLCVAFAATPDCRFDMFYMYEKFSEALLEFLPLYYRA